MLRRKSSKSPDASDFAPVYRKPRADVYTVLLAIALAALLVGILFFYLENSRYEFKSEGAPRISTNLLAPTAPSALQALA